MAVSVEVEISYLFVSGLTLIYLVVVATDVEQT